MDKISVYIIAYNQEDKIEAALKSVQWADEIVVADSFSTDRTAIIAEQYGAKVVQIPFSGFGDLRNRAIDSCSYGWIFSLDSDERCTPEAEAEILSIVRGIANNCHNPVLDSISSQSGALTISGAGSKRKSDSRFDLYYVPRKNFFMGRWIRHSGYYPDYRQPQLFRKGTLVFRNDPVHESYDMVSSGGAGYLKSSINQIPYMNLEEMIAKKNRYSTLGAEKLKKNTISSDGSGKKGEASRAAGSTEKKSGVTSNRKNGVRVTMSDALFHGIWSFFRTYIIKLGFLDGWPGFVIAFGNFEETFYKYAKFYESFQKIDPGL